MARVVEAVDFENLRSDDPDGQLIVQVLGFNYTMAPKSGTRGYMFMNRGGNPDFPSKSATFICLLEDEKLFLQFESEEEVAWALEKKEIRVLVGCFRTWTVVKPAQIPVTPAANYTV